MRFGERQVLVASLVGSVMAMGVLIPWGSARATLWYVAVGAVPHLLFSCHCAISLDLMWTLRHFLPTPDG